MNINRKALYALIAVIVLTVAQMFVSHQAHAQATSKAPDIFTHGCQVGIGIIHVHLKLYESYKHDLLVVLCEGAYSALPSLRKEYTEQSSGHNKFAFACGVAVGVGITAYERQDIIADEPTLLNLVNQCLAVADMLLDKGYFK